MTDNFNIDTDDLIIPPKLTQELKTIIDVNGTILKSINSQRARLYDRLDSELNLIKDEIGIPANKYLDWVKVVSPFVEKVIDTRVLDYEVIERYRGFLQEVINHEKEFLISQDYINKVSNNTDRLVGSLLKVEQRTEEIKQEANEIITSLHERLMNKHKMLKPVERYIPGCCVYCGKRLYKDDGDGDTQCINCSTIPTYKKPFCKIPDWYYDGGMPVAKPKKTQEKIKEGYNEKKTKTKIDYKNNSDKAGSKKTKDTTEEDQEPQDEEEKPKIDYSNMSDEEKMVSMIQTAFPKDRSMKLFANKLKKETEEKDGGKDSDIEKGDKNDEE